MPIGLTPNNPLHRTVPASLGAICTDRRMRAVRLLRMTSLMPSRDEYLKLLQREFFPYVRGTGFKGSRVTLRRQRGEVIHVINVQGSSTADRCYLNLGVHLAFLPTEGGIVVSLSKIKEYECAFRRRVDPPSEYRFGWPYGRTPTEATDCLSKLVAAYKTQGEPYFARLADYPGSFDTVSPDDLHEPSPWSTLGATTPTLFLTFARIALHGGDVSRARDFARAGLEQAPRTATILHRLLQKILDSP
ncbi:MAG TPA: DUF4304 domain-containing protein [Candidatus Binatia bacterium]|nr:DUF4304 domain-containing protein [Candidatus Binatia bacterium]